VRVHPVGGAAAGSGNNLKCQILLQKLTQQKKKIITKTTPTQKGESERGRAVNTVSLPGQLNKDD